MYYVYHVDRSGRHSHSGHVADPHEEKLKQLNKIYKQSNYFQQYGHYDDKVEG